MKPAENITKFVTSLFHNKYYHYLLLLLLFLLTLWLYGPTLNIPLLADDYVWLFDIVPFDNLRVFFERHFSILDREYRYRPLMPMMVRVCYSISGPDPFCMHLTSLLIHFFNTLLVGVLALTLTKNKGVAWAASFFFATYFAHVENVAWVSDMGNLLVAFFMLITAILFIRAIEQKSYHLYGLSLLSFVLAMMSKESALALAPILLIWGFIFFLRKDHTISKKLIGLAGGSYALLLMVYLFFVNRTGFNFALGGQTAYAYRFDLSTLRNIIYYPLNFIWPTNSQTIEIIYQNFFDLSRTYTEMKPEIFAKILAIPGLIWVVGGTLAIWVGVLWLLLWRRQIIDRLALIWISLGILPVIFIAGHGERHIYVASIGLSLLVGHLFFSKQYSNKTTMVIARGVFIIILLLNIHWTQIRVKNWHMTGQSAKEVIATVMQSYPNLSTGSELWFVGLSDELNGVHFFRHGIEEALEVEIGDRHRSLTAHRVSRIDDIPHPLTDRQYAFVFKDENLLDLTPNYRE